jgi:glutamate-1-semialdehyde 2,1-aminomutase
MTALGKVVGGGMPLAAYGGREDIMNVVAPLGPVYQAGTLSGNPIAVAAGLAQLKHCTDEVYVAVDRTATALGALVSEALEKEGVVHRLNTAGSLFSVFFCDPAVVDFATATSQNVLRYKAFFHEMLARGVYLPPSAYEAWFVGATHDDTVLERIADALPHAARAAAAVHAPELESRPAAEDRA